MDKLETKDFPDRRFGKPGSVAVVTGASHGIGLACARRLALHGWEVVLVSRTADSLAEVERHFASEGLKVRSAVCDVCDLDAFAALINGLDRLDVLVNNAGGNRPAPFVEITRQDFDWLIDLNVRSVFFASQAALRKMIQTGAKGSIINMSSQMGHVGCLNAPSIASLNTLSKDSPKHLLWKPLHSVFGSTPLLPPSC
jgi:NAD(P)-dependent dehydrogenase (short-subunit alcohol dehydrogenase family)